MPSRRGLRCQRRGQGNSDALSSQQLAEHFFRHEYGKLVALLVARVGAQWLEDVEDAVQQALLKALENWSHKEVPHNPSAWLYRVSHNELMDKLRQYPRQQQLLQQHGEMLGESFEPAPEFLDDNQIQDDLLRLLFACCDASIPSETRLVLALKVVCGFDVREIALRLFTSEANVYKRLTRARQRLKQQTFAPDDLNREQFAARLPAVHHILYLLFTEGHLSHHLQNSLRKELCEEAIRLTSLLHHHPIGQTPETCALLALMHLHMARMDARQDESGRLLLLEEQDRSRWDQAHIATGIAWLSQSAQGTVFSRYHAEAAIAADHCMAPSFAATPWEKIARAYSRLERIAPSPLHTLNRAVAVAHWQGPEAALSLLQTSEAPPWLLGNYQWSAVLADLHRQAGHSEEWEHHAKKALSQAPTEAVKESLQRRLLGPRLITD